MGKWYLFAVRAPSRVVHDRLLIAAKQDGLTVPAELEKLLDLREQWHALTTADHPLARPAPVPALNHMPCCVISQREEMEREEAGIEGIDWWYGKRYWQPTPVDNSTGSVVSVR